MLGTSISMDSWQCKWFDVRHCGEQYADGSTSVAACLNARTAIATFGRYMINFRILEALSHPNLLPLMSHHDLIHTILAEKTGSDGTNRSEHGQVEKVRKRLNHLSHTSRKIEEGESKEKQKGALEQNFIQRSIS